MACWGNLYSCFWLYASKFWEVVGSYEWYFRSYMNAAWVVLSIKGGRDIQTLLAVKKLFALSGSRDTKFFLKKILEDISPSCEATDTPVLDFWSYLLWVSKLEWAALFMLGGGIHVSHSLRFTSGVTPADLSVASMAAKPFSSMYL